MTDVEGLAFSEAELISVDDLQPASYNPRQVFQERLELVKLSLQKLGWLLPIYADMNGEILSGHQRHHVAVEMLGATKVPVVRTKVLGSRQRRGLNMVFNRITNDLAQDEQSEALIEALTTSDIPARAAALPDIEIDSDDWFKIMAAKPVSVADLLDANPLWMDPHAVGLTSYMRYLGTSVMPVVCTPSLRLVNGRARAMAAGLAGVKTIHAVVIPEDVAEIAHGLLNLLSMRYDLEGGLANDFRANAHRAAPSVRHHMSVNSTYDLLRTDGGSARSPLRWFDHTREDHAAAWLAFYGPSVCDFGAGHYADARHMVEMGAQVAAFEPYFEFDRERAAAMAREWFFPRIADGRRFNTIFLSNVINSVPFEDDRRHIVTLAASLADEHTLLCASTRGTDELRGVRRNTSARNLRESRSVEADYERNTVVANLSVRPLVQKFHTHLEFAELWGRGFRHVEHSLHGERCFVRARNPIVPTAAEVRAAIEFEFDLPFEDGRLGLVDDAVEAWRARGWDL